MLRKVRYHHFNTGLLCAGDHFRGATVKFTPVDQEYVQVQHTFCSKEDTFCKRVGREEADRSEPNVIPVSHVPTYLAGLDAKVYGVNLKHVKQYQANKFAWVWKYFL